MRTIMSVSRPSSPSCASLTLARVPSWNADTDDYNWVTQGLPAIRKNYQSILNNQSAGAYDDSGVIVLTHEMCVPFLLLLVFCRKRC